MAEGTLSTTLVPFFTEALNSNSKENFRNLRNHLFTLTFFVLIGVTSLFYFFANEFVNIFAYGFDSNAREISAQLLQKMSPFLFLISLSALNMGLLNSVKKFNPPAFSPVLMNLGIIIVILISFFYFSLDINILAYAVVFGALLQYLFQVPFIFKNRLVYNFNFKDCINPKTKEIFKVIFPQIFGLAVYNLNILINTQFASFLEKGSITYLYLAERLIEFPLGIFAVSIATTTLPDLSNNFTNKNYKGFSNIINEKLKFIIFLSAPFAVAFIMLGQDLCNVLYSRGEFSEEDSIATYLALLGYSFGLIFIAGLRLITQGFYAIKNTRLPVIYGAYNLLVNFVLCYILAFYFNLSFFGLAIASSISSLFLFIFLSIRLKEYFSDIDLLSALKYLALILILSFVSIFIAQQIIEILFVSYLLLSLLMKALLSFVIFCSLSRILKIHELRLIFK